MGIAVNAPKSPVTKGSSGTAIATLPNVCKMPGPPAPFVPTPLPNIGKSDNSPQGYSTSVTFEGNPVAIQGATFNSTGDVASQGTGGGIVSSNVQGPTSFIGPGSMDVKIEGKNVQLLSDQMLNNGGPSGSPPNAATMGGILQGPGMPTSDGGVVQTGALKVTVTDVCNGNPVEGALVSTNDISKPAAQSTDSSGIANLSQLVVGEMDVTVSKNFSEADYSKFIVQYPRLMWKGKARSTGTGTADIPPGGTVDLEIKITVLPTRK